MGPWRATVWEACGFVARRRVTRLGAFYVKGTFGEYLASSNEGVKDRVERKSTGPSPTGPAPASVITSVESVDGLDVGEGDGIEPVCSDDERSPALSPSGGNVGGVFLAEGSSSKSSSSSKKPPSDRPVSETRREARRRRRAARAEKEPPKPRRVTARCWLAEGFPVRVEDVSPILDIAARANKHLKKAKRVVEYWRGAHAGTFPVKVTVPIMMTVYATIDFRNFRAAADGDGNEKRASSRNKPKDETKKDERGTSDAPLDFSARAPSDPAYFEVPPGYARKTLVQALREAEEEERRQLEAEARARKAKREEAHKQKHAAKK